MNTQIFISPGTYFCAGGGGEVAAGRGLQGSCDSPPVSGTATCRLSDFLALVTEFSCAQAALSEWLPLYRVLPPAPEATGLCLTFALPEKVGSQHCPVPLTTVRVFLLPGARWSYREKRVNTPTVKAGQLHSVVMSRCVLCPCFIRPRPHGSLCHEAHALLHFPVSFVMVQRPSNTDPFALNFIWAQPPQPALNQCLPEHGLLPVHCQPSFLRVICLLQTHKTHSWSFN